jgi:hypothetical protein
MWEFWVSYVVCLLVTLIILGLDCKYTEDWTEADSKFASFICVMAFVPILNVLFAATAVLVGASELFAKVFNKYKGL